MNSHPRNWFFPVTEAPVHATVTHNGTTHRVPLPRRKALVAADTGEIIGVVGEGYIAELGGNAYAAFNTMTDLAARPPRSPRFRRDRPTLERRAGAWLREFHIAASRPGFTIATHLAKLTSPTPQPPALVPLTNDQ